VQASCSRFLFFPPFFFFLQQPAIGVFRTWSETIFAFFPPSLARNDASLHDIFGVVVFSPPLPGKTSSNMRDVSFPPFFPTNDRAFRPTFFGTTSFFLPFPSLFWLHSQGTTHFYDDLLPRLPPPLPSARSERLQSIYVKCFSPFSRDFDRK